MMAKKRRPSTRALLARMGTKRKNPPKKRRR